jgi:predicted SprT family Zn-dependent metalloprotease
MNPHMQELEAYAQQKLEQWALTDKGWKFAWNSRRTSFGLCSPRRKTIFLSTFLLSTVPLDEHKDTVLHEIAHALDFEERGFSNHDRYWKRKAIEVGAAPVACRSVQDNTTILQQSKYTLVCPNGHEYPKHRMLKHKRSCPKCCPVYNENFLLRVIQNY